MHAQLVLGPLNEAVKHTSSDLRAAKRRHSRQMKKWTMQESFTIQWLRVLWMLSAGSQHVMQAAWILHTERLQSVWDRSNVDACEIWETIGKQLEEEQLTEESMNALCNPTEKLAVDAWYQAWMFLAEWRLAMAILSLNVDAKLVATPAAIHTRFQQYISTPHPCVPVEVINRAVAVLAKRSEPEAQRQWLCRWRQKWGFRHRSLPNRCLMHGQEILEKVITFVWKSHHSFGVPKVAPFA